MVVLIRREKTDIVVDRAIRPENDVQWFELGLNIPISAQQGLDCTASLIGPTSKTHYQAATFERSGRLVVKTKTCSTHRRET
jgi:hypothetical protein